MHIEEGFSSYPRHNRRQQAFTPIKIEFRFFFFAYALIKDGQREYVRQSRTKVRSWFPALLLAFLPFSFAP
jgi:hypothetical protein